MNRILKLRTVAAVVLIGCCSLLAIAQTPSVGQQAPAASSAAAEPTAEPTPDATGKKSFRLSIGADGGKDEKPHGIEISLDGDENHAAVVAKVIGRIETALEGLPEEVRSSEQGDIAELRAAMDDLRAMKAAPEVHREIRDYRFSRSSRRVIVRWPR